MEIVPERTARTVTETVNVTATITGAAPRPMDSTTRTGRSPHWRPEWISVTWRRTRAGDAPWSTWEIHGRNVCGPKLKKDGTLAATGLYHDTYCRVNVGEWAEWFQSTRPAGGA